MQVVDGNLYDEEAEKALLGTLFVDPEELVHVQGMISERDFYIEPHRAIWHAMVQVVKDGGDVDAVSVASTMQSFGTFERSGAAPYMSDLIDCRPVIPHAVEYARRIASAAKWRRTRDHARRLELMLSEPNVNEADVEKAMRRLRLESEGSVEPLRGCTASELMQKQYQDKDRWLIHGLWLAGGCGIVAGPPKSSKSTATLLAGMAVASEGDPFLWKWPIAEHGDVVYINEEDCERDVRGRINKLAKMSGINPDLPRLHIFAQVGCDLTSAGGRARLSATIRDIRPKLTVLDCWRRVAPGRNENDSKDVSEALHFLRRLSVDYGTAIQLVHHFKLRDAYNKNYHATEMIRGTGDFAAWYDSFWGLERVKKGQPKHHFCADHRSAGELEPIELSITWDDEADEIHIVVGGPATDSKKRRAQEQMDAF